MGSLGAMGIMKRETGISMPPRIPRNPMLPIPADPRPVSVRQSADYAEAREDDSPIIPRFPIIPLFHYSNPES